MSIELIVDEGEKSLNIGGNSVRLDDSFQRAEVDHEQRTVVLKYDPHSGKFEDSPVVLDGEKITGILDNKYLKKQINLSPYSNRDEEIKEDYLCIMCGNDVNLEVRRD